MAKRSTQVEVTKIFTNGEEIITLNKNKMNKDMCKEIVSRLSKDWGEKNEDSDVKDVIFRCVG